MNEKQPFVKGLSALIPKKERQVPQGFKDNDAVFYISVSDVKPNPFQPRTEFDLEALRALSESINDYGILQPLVVSKVEKLADSGQKAEYQLIAGERRLIAAKMAGLKEVPVIIRKTSSQEQFELALIENVQREDLNAMERAVAYKKLETDYGLSQKEIGRICGKSRQAVANTIRLLNLPEEIKQAVKDSKITEGHARAILGVSDAKKQNFIFAKILDKGLSVREVEDFVQRINIVPATEDVQIDPKLQSLQKEFSRYEEDLKKYLNLTDLKISAQMGKPKLTISFDSKKAMDEFVKRFRV